MSHPHSVLNDPGQPLSSVAAVAIILINELRAKIFKLIHRFFRQLSEPGQSWSNKCCWKHFTKNDLIPCLQGHLLLKVENVTHGSDFPSKCLKVGTTKSFSFGSSIIHSVSGDLLTPQVAIIVRSRGLVNRLYPLIFLVIFANICALQSFRSSFFTSLFLGVRCSEQTTSAIGCGISIGLTIEVFCFGCSISGLRTFSSISFSSISGLQGSYSIFLCASSENWLSRCNSIIFAVNSARVSSNAWLAAAAYCADASSIAIIFVICSCMEWSWELSIVETTFLAGAIAFCSNLPIDGANCWCWKSAKGINDKQLPKNFNLFGLMKKVI